MKQSIYFTICVALSGCLFRDTLCERNPTDARCLAQLDAGTDGATDAAVLDAATDATPDAAPSCDSGVYRADAMACVACLADTDCEEGVCNDETNTCVECNDTPDCTDGTYCADDHTCVACLVDEHCPASAPVCGDDHQCTGCTVRDHCTRFEATPACNTASGECKQCDPSTETATTAGDCGANSCNPDTWECTTTGRASLLFCDACLTDSECSSNTIGTFRCVEIVWSIDEDRSGRYCVLDKATQDGDASAACPREMQTEIVDIESRSGVRSNYCAPRRTVTTCEAIQAVEDGTSCSSTSCPVGSTCVGGFCRRRCSEGVDCPEGQSCPAGDPRYCI